MCGIAGIFAYGNGAPPVDSGEILKIREAMRTRGPDGEGLWISDDRRVGFAHRRLAIIDLSDAASQPMASASGDCVITFNGEIYNYRELRKELERDGYPFRSTSDTEVLLGLYQRHGHDMVHRLRGMFAFAIWDERNKGLFLARDHFGIKPLYYADDGAAIRVASQVKALLKGGRIDTTPEPAGHVGFYLWGHVPEPYTLYRGVRALPAGSTLWVDAAGHRESGFFFDLKRELEVAAAMPASIALEEMRERLRAALLDTVRHHLIADVPVGVFLSAGLDSTTVTALAKDAGGGDLRTVTLGFREFEGTDHDEVPLAEQVARQYGTNHHTQWITKEDFQNEYPRLLQAMDQPSTDGVNSYFVNKAAHDSGLKVVLSGLGGDELFGSYSSFKQIPRLVKAVRPFNSSPAVGRGFRYASAAMLSHFTSPKYAGLLEYGGTFGGAYLLRRGMFMPWELPSVLDGDMVRQGWQELQPLSRLEQTVPGIDNAHLKVTALETAWYMRNQLLRDTDWASMAHSLEVRVPLVDVELFRSVAPQMNSSLAPTKLDMARTPRTPLPEKILKRKKSGFTVPVRDWLQRLRVPTSADRGLRTWAKHVYRNWDGAKTAAAPTARPTNVIFRIGQLGDTLVALPAVEALQGNFPGHRWILLTDRASGATGHVLSWDVLGSTAWFDRVIYYDPKSSGWDRVRMLLSVAAGIRRSKVDQIFNLAPDRSSWQRLRDKWFFSALVGARNYHAPVHNRRAEKDAQGKLRTLDPEWRHLLRSVGAGEPGNNAFRLAIPEEAREMARRATWHESIHPGAHLLAIGPGSKMPAKRWPAESYAKLGVRLLNNFPGLRLLVLGGREDAVLGQELCRVWGRSASNLAGKLPVYGSAAVLEKCVGYVGNDTGTMHLAAMVGKPCVVLFSARDNPGKWHPYGSGHTILRRGDVECAGCMLEVCDKNNRCLTLIGVEEAYVAACQLIESAGAQACDRLGPSSGVTNY